MKKDLWNVVVLHLGITNLMLALLDDLVGLVTRIGCRVEDFNLIKQVMCYLKKLNFDAHKKIFKRLAITKVV